MSCPISFIHVKANWHILSWFSVTDTRISLNFKINSNTSERFNNIRIVQTEILKEYIFYQLGTIINSSSFQQSNFLSFSYFSIQYFNDSGRIYKNSNLQSNSSVKDIFYCSHIPHSIGV